MGETRATERKLGREEIVAVARQLLADGGVDALTMRRVAEACGVKGPALYWHFKDKDELLGQIIDSVIRDLDDGTIDQVWTERMLVLGRSCRSLLMQHRGLATVAAGGYTLPESLLESLDEVIGTLARAGFTHRQALSIYYSVLTFTTGFAVYETTSPMLHVLASPEGDPQRGASTAFFEEVTEGRFPDLGAVARTFDTVNVDEMFDQGLTALVQGWAARLEAQS